MDKDRIEKILVTGASGFIGRKLCEKLKASGYVVIALGRHASEGPWDQFVECDLSSGDVPVKALQGVGTIYHLASKAHDFDNPNTGYDEVIVGGTRSLVEAARSSDVRSFVYMSSVKAMGEGNPTGLPLERIDEGWPHTPQSTYGLAKFKAERIVLDGQFAHAVVLRPTMVYGEGGPGNLHRMSVAIRNKRFPPLPETGNKRSMIHVDDLVEFCLRAAVTNAAVGKTYIVTHDEAVSTRQLYDTIRKSLGLPAVNWSVPLWMLKAAAALGSVIGGLTGKTVPLDRETLGKLTGSAWYNSASAEADMKFSARTDVLSWLESQTDV